MRTISLTTLITGAAFMAATPALAQSYNSYGYNEGGTYGYTDNCQRIQRDQRVGGALVGGVLGGLAGFGLAGNEGVEDEGAILGAVVGALAGSEVGKRQSRCNPKVYGPNTGQTTGYQTTAYQRDELYGGYRDYAETKPYYGGTASGQRTYSGTGYGNHSYEGYRSDTPAATQCEQVMRVTRLPDGREIHEPATACREAYYGDWEVDHRR